MAKVVQHCEIKTNKVKCGRLATLWVSRSYTGWNNVPRTDTLASCQRCQDTYQHTLIERIAA